MLNPLNSQWFYNQPQMARKEENMAKIIARTGHPAPKSGQYRPSGSRREITLSRGDVTPPNNFGVRHKFTLVDETKHKSK